MTNKIKRYIKEIVQFMVILIILANAISYYKSMDLNKEKLNLKEIKLIDNSSYSFEKKKPILIHFWATWCPVCKVEAPNIEKLSKDYEVITIAVNSKNIKQYLKENDLSFKVYDDKDNSYANKFNISVYPTTLIYDKNKSLIFSEVGYTSTLGLQLRMLWADF
ncbi:MAG: redoxin domain-containing protein [Campylobacterota bacterium]|nr:redoxin domain-containing protein [Campylobacterota bacterium]